MSESTPRMATEKKSLPLPTSIVKRDGSSVTFDKTKIASAAEKALKETGEYKAGLPSVVSDAVVVALSHRKDASSNPPTVEDVQDLVEKELMLLGLTETAKAYILYRQKRAEERKQVAMVPQEVKELVDSSKKYFQNQLSEFIFYTMYARWIPEKGRRESWIEAIDRYIDFMRENIGSKLTEAEYAEVRESMLKMEAMGSMRLLWSAGEAARKTNVCVYNCAYIAPSAWRDFGEIMYVLMCGTGMGFSVERQTVEQLPLIQRQRGEMLPTHEVEDSKEGWANAFVKALDVWSSGRDIQFDYSKIRPQGARLKTMGGRASGPDPLIKLINYTREKMLARQGRHLTTLDVHDIICMIGEIVVAGGVRRSALISLSDLDDSDLRTAKNGQFYLTNPERSMANNSVAYNEKPTMRQFLDEWTNLAISGSGERGIFNRGSLTQQVPARRWRNLSQEERWKTGTNPCGEIVLKSKQFCNLSEVVARAEDTEETLMKKVRIATILGTYQASLTKFNYLSEDWKNNCDEEALLGVSITGQWDSPVVRSPQTLRKLKEIAVEVNREYAARFGINPSTCVTTVKPSGNGSQLFNCSSGLHPRHAKYYIRRVRIEGHNPLFKMLVDEGVPYHPEVGQTRENAKTWVLEFPVKAPAGAVVKDDVSALDHLAYWKVAKENYTEHNPSVTISVGENEWLAVGDWVYKNWDIVGGLSFLPRSEHIYQLAPYEEISAEEYEARAKAFPAIDFSKLYVYEQEDVTEGAKTLACTGGTCEIV